MTDDFLQQPPDPRREEIADQLMDQLAMLSQMQNDLAKAMHEMSYLMQVKFGEMQEQIDDINNPDAPKVCLNPDWKPGDVLP